MTTLSLHERKCHSLNPTNNHLSIFHYDLSYIQPSLHAYLHSIYEYIDIPHHKRPLFLQWFQYALSLNLAFANIDAFSFHGALRSPKLLSIIFNIKNTLEWYHLCEHLHAGYDGFHIWNKNILSIIIHFVPHCNTCNNIVLLAAQREIELHAHGNKPTYYHTLHQHLEHQHQHQHDDDEPDDEHQHQHDDDEHDDDEHLHDDDDEHLHDDDDEHQHDDDHDHEHIYSLF